VSALFTQCKGDTVQTRTGKVDPARKFKCTTAARDCSIGCTLIRGYCSIVYTLIRGYCSKCCERVIQFYCLHVYILYRRNTILLFTCLHIVQEEYNSIVYMFTYCTGEIQFYCLHAYCLHVVKGEIIPFYCLHVYKLYRGDTVLLFTCLPVVKRRCCSIVSCKLRRRSLGKPYYKNWNSYSKIYWIFYQKS